MPPTARAILAGSATHAPPQRLAERPMPSNEGAAWNISLFHYRNEGAAMDASFESTLH
jgi:hypothetical protein